VEDNRENRLLLVSLLRKAGFEVREAVVQNFEAYGTEICLLYRLHSLDRDVAPSVQDISVGSIGARVKF